MIISPAFSRDRLNIILFFVAPIRLLSFAVFVIVVVVVVVLAESAFLVIGCCCCCCTEQALLVRGGKL